MKKLLYISIILPLIITSCHKKNIYEHQEINLIGPTLIILNEGNFNYGNASITLYNINSSKIIDNAFFKANNHLLGDIAQSAFIINSELYIIINNSGKIIKTDLYSLRQISELTGLTSPRYATKLADSQIIVTDLYSPYLSVFDPKDMTISKKILIHHTSEKIIMLNNYLYTIAWNNDSLLLKINASSLTITDSIHLTYQPNSMVIDQNNRLWVLCDGGLWQGADTLMNAALWQIEPGSMSVLKKYTFNNINLSPSHLCINDTKDTLFYLISSWQPTTDSAFGVYRMNIYDNTLPNKAWIRQNKHTFYSLQYIPEKKWIIVTDAKNFTTQGQVIVYNSKGEILITIPASIIPGYVLYKK